jgi:hypothetical protein
VAVTVLVAVTVTVAVLVELEDLDGEIVKGAERLVTGLVKGVGG